MLIFPADAPPPSFWCSYHYLMAFHIFLQERGQTDLCARTAENPKATRQYHPLTLNVMEKPKEDGGLGMPMVALSYCQCTTSPFQRLHKATNLWADDPDGLEPFVTGNGPCSSETRHLCGSAPDDVTMRLVRPQVSRRSSARTRSASATASVRTNRFGRRKATRTHARTAAASTRTRSHRAWSSTNRG